MLASSPLAVRVRETCLSRSVGSCSSSSCSGVAVGGLSRSSRRLLSRQSVSASRAGLQKRNRISAIAIHSSSSDEDLCAGFEPDAADFVSFFRTSAPYIEGHRGRTFVISVPGDVVDNESQFFPFLEDLLVLNGLGVRVVLVYGCSAIVNKQLKERGLPIMFVGGYRVSTPEVMQVAMEVAGMVRLEIEAKLSRGPSVSVVRRHTRDANQFRFAPPVGVVGGNYTTAKRRGVVGGVDFGFTGEVRFIQGSSIEEQLKAGNIVVLSSIGFSAVGEVLNCNYQDVASHAAIALKADKLICMTTESVRNLELPGWMTLKDAEKKVLELTGVLPQMDKSSMFDSVEIEQSGSVEIVEGNSSQVPWTWDLDKWRSDGVPMEIVSCVAVCTNGVKRAHLVDAAMDGGLLLELYSRDGIGTMVSSDFYEGIQPATFRDIEDIIQLLQPLVRAGVVVNRSPETLMEEIDDYTVVVRDSKVLGCAQLKNLGTNSAGMKCAEVAAFCVDPSYRNGGRGDSLLDYLEQKAREQNYDYLVLLTTRTADWFCCRGFKEAGVAYKAEILPESRRAKIDPSRNSKAYSKRLVPVPKTGLAPAGKRIGF